MRKDHLVHSEERNAMMDNMLNVASAGNGEAELVDAEAAAGDRARLLCAADGPTGALPLQFRSRRRWSRRCRGRGRRSRWRRWTRTGERTATLIQSGASGERLGWVDLDLGSSLRWLAATVATYCPSRMVEHPKSNSTQPSRSPDAPDCTSFYKYNKQ